MSILYVYIYFIRKNAAYDVRLAPIIYVYYFYSKRIYIYVIRVNAAYDVRLAPIIYVYIYFVRINLILYVYTYICIHIRWSAVRWRMMCGLQWKAEGFLHRCC
jgi:hypothetical protein